MTYTIRRCRGNVEAWCLDTGTSMIGPTATSLDTLVQILAGYQADDARGPHMIVIDRATERQAALAKMQREEQALATQAREIAAERARLKARMGSVQ